VQYNSVHLPSLWGKILKQKQNLRISILKKEKKYNSMLHSGVQTNPACRPVAGKLFKICCWGLIQINAKFWCFGPVGRKS
jgi:hypothetical protein